jgi:hypothetical protein
MTSRGGRSIRRYLTFRMSIVRLGKCKPAVRKKARLNRFQFSKVCQTEASIKSVQRSPKRGLRTKVSCLGIHILMRLCPLISLSVASRSFKIFSNYWAVRGTAACADPAPKSKHAAAATDPSLDAPGRFRIMSHSQRGR